MAKNKEKSQKPVPADDRIREFMPELANRNQFFALKRACFLFLCTQITAIKRLTGCCFEKSATAFPPLIGKRSPRRLRRAAIPSEQTAF